VPEAHHPLSHHGFDPAKMAKLAKINAFHVSLFADFLGKLKPRPMATAHYSIIPSICMAAGWVIPTCTITRISRFCSRAAAPASLKGGRHIKYDKPTPLANLP